MNQEKDANNNLFEQSNNSSKNFALLFEFSADVKAIRHCIYNVKAQRPNVDGATKGKNIEVKTDILNITARPALDTGTVKVKTSDETIAEAYENWYKAVPVFKKTVSA